MSFRPPYDLVGWGKRSLKRLKEEQLIAECEMRMLPSDGLSEEGLVRELCNWKRRRNRPAQKRQQEPDNHANSNQEGPELESEASASTQAGLSNEGQLDQHANLPHKGTRREHEERHETEEFSDQHSQSDVNSKTSQSSLRTKNLGRKEAGDNRDWPLHSLEIWESILAKPGLRLDGQVKTFENQFSKVVFRIESEAAGQKILLFIRGNHHFWEGSENVKFDMTRIQPNRHLLEGRKLLPIAYNVELVVPETARPHQQGKVSSVRRGSTDASDSTEQRERQRRKKYEGMSQEALITRVLELEGKTDRKEIEKIVQGLDADALGVNFESSKKADYQGREVPFDTRRQADICYWDQRRTTWTVREVKEVKEGDINGAPVQAWRYLDDFQATDYYQKLKPEPALKMEIVPFLKVSVTPDGKPIISKTQQRLYGQLFRFLAFQPECTVATAYAVQVDRTETQVKQAWKIDNPSAELGEWTLVR